MTSAKAAGKRQPYHITGPAPDGAGQVAAMRKALTQAGLAPAGTIAAERGAIQTIGEALAAVAREKGVFGYPGDGTNRWAAP
jgi:3-oxoacyl-[acyl-carrier-protein] synthase II